MDKIENYTTIYQNKKNIIYIYIYIYFFSEIALKEI